MLDITAFSNALRNGRVSFLSTLGVRPLLEADGSVAGLRGDDAAVFPLARDGDRPELALRLPLEHNGGRSWPAHYADLAGAVGAIDAHLPREITILDVDDVPGTGVALLYDWVPGDTLTARVTRARERLDRDRLTELLWPLADIADALRVSGLVHGDIAPGNLIVRPDGGMVLVDLDRMGYREAEGAIEPRRRAGYRLPRGGGSPSEEDAFALLVLMATCGILADASRPLDHEQAPEWTHPTLLFSTWDLMDPQRSRLVREVEQQLSPLSRELLDHLIAACNGGSERVPGRLREAIRSIRRHGTRPGPQEAAPPGAEARWHRIAPPEPEASGWGDPPSTEAPTLGDSGWPVVDHPAEPSPVPAPGWGHGREVRDIIEELRTIPIAAPQTNARSRRSRRAERRRQEVAGQLERALAENDRTVLVELAMSGALAELGETDRDDVLQVVRALSHDSVTRAIATDDDAAIVFAIDESVFARESDLDPAFRDRVRLARDRERWTERVIAALRERDGRAGASLLREAPDGAVDRLPQSIRRQVERLVAEHEAVSGASAAIRARDTTGLARALGRLAEVKPTWTDDIDVAAVVALLGAEQIEQRLVSRFAGSGVADADQWLVDIVIAAGRLPEVTRLAGLSPRDVDRLIHRHG